MKNNGKPTTIFKAELIEGKMTIECFTPENQPQEALLTNALKRLELKIEKCIVSNMIAAEIKAQSEKKIVLPGLDDFLKRKKK